MALQHWLQLSLTDGIGPILIARLIETAGSAEAACALTPSDLQNIDGIGTSKSHKIAQSLRSAAAEAARELEKAHALGVHLLCPDDAAYPVLLRTIPDPPAVLYVMGDLQDRDLNAVAIVGSRRCSFYGREQAERFAALMAGAGIVVISGGARGVDSSAHRGALSHPQGRTIAVLGSGVDVAYPPENEPLFKQIATRGAVVSEYPLGTAPLKENFPRRNRIISGLSRGVLVVEADDRSGALITARQACDDHGRTVFALPGRVDNPLSRGPHQLIRDGAVLCACLDDIVDNLTPPPQNAVDPSLFPTPKSLTAPASHAPTPPKVAPSFSLSDRQQLILQAMGSDPATVDQIIESTSLAAAAVLQELTFLSLKGAVKRIDGQTFARRH